VLASVLVATLTLAGCKPVGPITIDPATRLPRSIKKAGASTALVPPPNPAGGGWQAANPSDSMLRGKWWEIYQDPQLNQLEERIAANNQSLRQALETYLAARDQVTSARAGLFPTLSGDISASRDRILRKSSFGKPHDSYNDLVIGGQASWEPDFWAGAFAAPLRLPAKPRRPTPPIRPTSISACMRRWLQTTFSCADSMPRQNC